MDVKLSEHTKWEICA